MCCSCLLGDRPGMLCSFKISTAWSCAWCLNPQADNCFSTGDLSAGLAAPSVSVGKTSCIHLPAATQITAKPTSYHLFSLGLTRRVLVTNVVTGHRQTFGTSSDVLAQQFATQVGRTRHHFSEQCLIGGLFVLFQQDSSYCT